MSANMSAHPSCNDGNSSQKNTKKINKNLNNQNAETLQLNNILLDAPGSIYWKDANGKYLGHNHAAAEMMKNLNLQWENIVGKTDYDLFSKEVADEFRKTDLEVMDKKCVKKKEETTKLANGDEIIQLSVKKPLFDNAGKVIGVVGNTIDITDSKKTEHYYLNSIVDTIPSSVYWKDKNGVYLGCNQAMVNKSNLKSKEDIIGKTDFDLWAEYAENLRKVDEEVMRTRQVSERQEIVKIHTGEEFYFTSIKAPFLINDEVFGIVGTSIDITDRKRAEQLLCEKEIAEKLTKFSNLIAGSIAHEIRTPLSVISLNMDILDGVISSVNLPSEEEGTCRQIIKEVKQIVKNGVHVISDMLLKVRSFATGQVHHHDFVSSSIATDVEEFLASFPFEFEHEKDLIKLKGFDSLANRFKYVGDHLLTQHLLSNLLRNALHAIRTEKKGNITIELQGGKGFNKLIFMDTASGIPADFVSKIFDQFETKKTTHGGTGLGLAFCKMVMQEYGGDIKCKSKEGEFTEFVLSFPNTDKK